MVDTPTKRESFADLTTDEQEEFLESLRSRRLLAQERYQLAQAIIAMAKEDKLRIKLEKQVAILEKNLASINNAIDKFEKRVKVIRTLSLEIEGLKTPINVGVVNGS